jgi:hypothetical protein
VKAPELRRLRGWREPTEKQKDEIYDACRLEFPDDEDQREALEFKVRYSRHRMPQIRQFIEAHLKIKDVAGRIIPFILNQTQRYALAQILREGRKREAWVDPSNGKVIYRRERDVGVAGKTRIFWRELASGAEFDQVPRSVWDGMHLERAPGPVLFIVLKARQHGISTLVQALFFESIMRGDNVAVKLMSHAGESAAEILEMPGRFIDYLEIDGRPIKLPMTSRNDSEGLIHFDKPIGGKITIGTAQAKKDPGRGSTYQKGHFTEIGDWEPKAYELMTALMQVVHHVPGTVVAAESTAKGAQGWFYDQWHLAERGESDFVPIFLPWFWSEEYRRDTATASELQEIENTLDDPKFCSASEETYLLEQVYYRPGHGHVKVDYYQLAWRRWAIFNKCGGILEKFHQEYPAFPAEAFLASGRPVFDQILMHKRLQAGQPEPFFVGELAPMDWKTFLSEEDPIDWFEKWPEPERVKNRFGHLRLWEEPDRELSYGISIDTSEGVEGGDYTCIVVGEFYTGRQVAEWHGLCNPIDAARIACRLGYWYGTALIGPEKNNHGYTCITELADNCLYPNLYQRKARAKVASAATDQFGWVTNPTTRKQLFNTMRRFFLDYPELFVSRPLLLEMQGMTYNERDIEVCPRRDQHGNAGHDDRVLAFGIFLQMRDEAFRLRIVKTPEKKKRNEFDAHWEGVDDLYEAHSAIPHPYGDTDE